MDSFFFWLSKLFWLLISPDNLIIICFAFGFFFLVLGNYLWSKRILGLLFASILLIGLFPVGEWLIYPLEAKYSQNQDLKNVDGIIVLAGPEQPIHTILKYKSVM